MIELSRDALEISFPELHRDARLRIDFQRTLRLPDDGREYPLPAGLGRFPLRHVDDFSARLPEAWRRHGGVMLPMYQAEAMWLHFTSLDRYPFAVKIAAGKINAVSGEGWREGLHRDPQDYCAVPGQPWLDGFCVEKGVVRQFVAAPLGMGATVEEQLTGEAEHGGLQILVHPLKAKVWEREQRAERARREEAPQIQYCRAAPDMGLAPGGRMRQEIYRDRRNLADWDQRVRARCFVHIASSPSWRQITGELPPTPPPTGKIYAAAGIPWFDYYDAELKALGGAPAFQGLKSAGEFAGLLPDEDDEAWVTPPLALKNRRHAKSVREF
jgi:hypothetical protein